MTKKELFEYLTSKPNPDPNGSQKREKTFKKKYPELYKQFNEFHFCEDLIDKPFYQKLYHFLQDDHGDIGCCQECGKRCDFKWFGTDGYSKFCSNKCSNKNEEAKLKRKETCIANHSGYGFAAKDIMTRFKSTMTEKYGHPYSSQCPEILNKIIESNNKNNNGIGFASKTVLNTFLNNMRIKYGNNWQTVSILENEIYEYIKSVYSGVILKNDRNILNGKELDIFIPNIKLAFEINGDFWHMNPKLYKKDENFYGRTVESEHIRRMIKTKLAKSKGIMLIHIWQYDWNNRKTFVKQLIKNLITNNYDKI